MKMIVIALMAAFLCGCDIDDKESENESPDNMVVISSSEFYGGGNNYRQDESECFGGKYSSMTYVNGILDSEHLGPCNSYQNYYVGGAKYSLKQDDDGILMAVNFDSTGTHCSYGDLSVSFDGIDGYDFGVSGHNSCLFPDVELIIPSLSESIAGYSSVVEFFGYNGEYVRKYISVDQWRVK